MIEWREGKIIFTSKVPSDVKLFSHYAFATLSHRDVTEAESELYCSRVGQVIGVRLIDNLETDIPKVLANTEFADADSVASISRNLHEFKVERNVLYVENAVPTI